MDRHAHSEDMIDRVEKMVAAGRLTEEEAERVRAAAADELDDVVREIRLRHVRARLDAALDDGSLTPDEAADILERVKQGEVPRFRVGQAGHATGRP